VIPGGVTLVSAGSRRGHKGGRQMLTESWMPTRIARRRIRAGAALAVAFATVLAAAGVTACSNGPAAPPVASLPGHTAGTQAGQPLSLARSDQNMVDFTHCMRGHGVQMADPFHRPGHAGLSIDLPSPVPANRAAYAACTHFIEQNIEAKQKGAAVQAAGQIPALTRYAQCMRAHDIGMLDPAPDGSLSLGNVPGIGSAFGRYSPQFRAADAACRHLLPAGVHDDGTGP
jgi:hypothetical protein